MSKRVLNMFWGIFFRKIFCPVFHGGSSLQKFSKKSKIFQNSKETQNLSHNCPNMFWTCFGVIISKIFFAQCSLVGRVFENSQKNQKLFKIAKMPKSFPKVSKRDLNMFWVNFFENFFCPVCHGGSSLRKISKNRNFLKVAKMPEIVPKSVQTCVEHILKRFFRKKFFCSVFLRESSCRKFSKKNQKLFKIAEKPKIVPKNVQTCFEHVLGYFFSKIFLPSVPWRVESSKIFKKIETF